MYVLLTWKHLHASYDLRMWFKGGDTTTIMLWLECVYDVINAETSNKYMIAIGGALRCANGFLRRLYAGGLWLTRAQALGALRAGEGFCDFYLKAAHYALLRQQLRFKLSPKWHAYTHFLHDLRFQLSTKSKWVLSPMMACCQMDEDCVGKVASLSQQGSFKKPICTQSEHI